MVQDFGNRPQEEAAVRSRSLPTAPHYEEVRDPVADFAIWSTLVRVSEHDILGALRVSQKTAEC